MSNTVDSNNFNKTMEGYTDYMIDFIVPVLKEEGYSEKKIERIVELIDHGFNWGKDEMTMSGAREYKRKY